jgi:hypothetical protein
MPFVVATLAIGPVIPGRLRSKRARNPLRNYARCELDSGFGSASRPGMTRRRECRTSLTLIQPSPGRSSLLFAIRLQDLQGGLVDEDHRSPARKIRRQLVRDFPGTNFIMHDRRACDGIKIGIVRRKIVFRDSRSRKLWRFQRRFLRDRVRRNCGRNDHQCQNKVWPCPQTDCSSHIDSWNPDKQNPGVASLTRATKKKRRALARRFELISYPRSSAASAIARDASTSAAPWPRSGGCALSSPRTAGRPLRGCGRCSCRCRSACGARALRAG